MIAEVVTVGHLEGFLANVAHFTIRRRTRHPRLRGRPPRRLQGAEKDARPGKNPKGATGQLQRIGLAEKLGLG